MATDIALPAGFKPLCSLCTVITFGMPVLGIQHVSIYSSAMLELSKSLYAFLFMCDIKGLNF